MKRKEKYILKFTDLKNNFHSVITVLGILFSVNLLISCEKEEDYNPKQIIQKGEKGIYVLNEGLWGNNNSSISYVSYDSNKVIDDIASSNWKHPLGDTGNSFFEKNDTVFVCVTSSNKIEMFNKSSGNLIHTFVFPQNTGPRNSVAHNGKLYVTSFLLGAVAVVDLRTFQQTKLILVGDHPDQLILSDNNLIVSVSGLGSENKIAVVNTVSETKTKIITVGINPAEILVSPNYILVHCIGTYVKSIFYRLNKSDYSVVDSVQIGKPIDQIGKFTEQKFYIIDEKNVLLVNEKLETESVLFSRSLLHSKIIFSSVYNSETGIFWITSTDTWTVRGWLEGFQNGVKKYGAFQVGISPGDLLVK